MTQLPQAVIALREAADDASDKEREAWEELSKIESPSHDDIEKWTAVRNLFTAAQKDFEDRLWEVIPG